METTTIWINVGTKKLLDILKREYHAPSYDSIVRKLAQDHLDEAIKKVAGTMPHLTKFERDKDDFERF